jgi:hypothetical protein
LRGSGFRVRRFECEVSPPTTSFFFGSDSWSLQDRGWLGDFLASPRRSTTGGRLSRGRAEASDAQCGDPDSDWLRSRPRGGRTTGKSSARRGIEVSRIHCDRGESLGVGSSTHRFRVRPRRIRGSGTCLRSRTDLSVRRHSRTLGQASDSSPMSASVSGAAQAERFSTAVKQQCRPRRRPASAALV